MKWIKNSTIIILAVLLMSRIILPEDIFAMDDKTPTIVVQSQESKPGEEVEVNISIKNNPGIAGATLEVEFDSKLTLKNAKNGDSLNALSFTMPAIFTNPSKFLWDSERGMSQLDGTMLTLQFQISDQANNNEELKIHVSYDEGDIYDENLDDVTLQLIDGSITAKREWDCTIDGHQYGSVPQKIEGSEVVPEKHECLKQGSYQTALFCEKCGEYDPKTLHTVYTDAKGHDPAEAVKEDIVESTCTKKGSYNAVVRCSVCDEVISTTPVEVEKAAHTPGEEVKEDIVEATCTKKGSYSAIVRCSVCDELISTTPVEVEKVAHTPGEAVKEDLVEATCIKEGSYNEVIKCMVCNEILSTTPVTVKKLNHIPTIDKAVKPTYSKTGLTQGSHCAICKTVLIKQKTIAKLIKKNATIKVKNSTVTVSAKKTKNANQYFMINAKVTGNGKITYKKVAGSSRLHVRKDGKVTIKKGTKKGTYKITVKLTAAESAQYKKKVVKTIIKAKVK